MNTAQKKKASSWLILAVVVGLTVLNEDFLNEHWDILKFPLLIVMVIVAAVARNRHRGDLEKEGRSNLNDVVNRYPILKWIIGVYAVGAFVASIIIILTGYRLSISVGSLMLALLPMMIPGFVLEIERYKALDDKADENSNGRYQ